MDFSVGRGPGTAGVATHAAASQLLCVVSQLPSYQTASACYTWPPVQERQALGLVGGAVLSASAVAQQVLG